MSYIDDSLGDHEAVLYRARFHPMIALFGGATFMLLALLGAYAWLEGYPVLASAAVLTGAALLVVIMYPVWSHDIAVTNQRIIKHRGILSRATEELQLDAVEEIRVEQSFLGRLLNYGTVVITGRGERTIWLPALLLDPVGLRQQLQNAVASPSAHPVVETTAPRRVLAS